MLFIYGKTSDMNCMRPIDLSSGQFVYNVLYATMWGNDEDDIVRGIVEELKRQNKDIVFEIRKKGR